MGLGSCKERSAKRLIAFLFASRQRRRRGSNANRIGIVLCFLITSTVALAQSTSFTYQGRLTDSGTSANGNYDLQFGLWNSSSGGGQIGSTVTLNSVALSNGIFTVNLDFGANAFPGPSRFLEIAVRPAGVGSFTTLTPRQPITSTPYAVRSLNAATADSVPASGVAAGSGNYIQNSTSPQSASNFNITGTGSATVINATSQFDMNGERLLSTSGVNNLFLGFNAGIANTTGNRNVIIGTANTGSVNSTGFDNSFFGEAVGTKNTSGNNNSFFGAAAGNQNVSGSENTFIGVLSGESNNSNSNTFIGVQSGEANTNGSSNTFVGHHTGVNNFNGFENTLIGFRAEVGADLIFNSTAIGTRAQVDISNALVLGGVSGVNGGSDTKVGIGTTAPTARLSVVATGDGARVLHLGTERAWVFRQFGTGAAAALELTADDQNNNNKNFLINTTGFVGIGTTAPTANLSVNGSANKPGGGSWGTFSDERLKTIKGRFTPGLHALMQLQPLRYEYKPDNALKLKSEGEYVGFSAQALQKVVPEAVSQTDSGFLVVNNDPILWTMLNAIKEQQTQLQQQRTLIIQLRARLARLERRRS